MPERLTSPWWDTPAIRDNDGLHIPVKTTINASYPVIDSRTTGDRPARGLEWNHCPVVYAWNVPTKIDRGPWPPWVVWWSRQYAKFPYYRWDETDLYGDGRMCVLTDDGVWLASGRKGKLMTQLEGPSLRGASFHPWGEWDDRVWSGDVASRIPSWGMVDPNWRTAAAIGLPAWAIESNTTVGPAKATDVRRPEPDKRTGDRGADPGEGFPMGSRLVMSEAAATRAYERLEQVESSVAAPKVREIIDDLVKFGGVLMNTTSDLHGSINRIDLTADEKLLAGNVLVDNEWVAATPQLVST